MYVGVSTEKHELKKVLARAKNLGQRVTDPTHRGGGGGGGGGSPLGGGGGGG